MSLHASQITVPVGTNVRAFLVVMAAFMALSVPGLAPRAQQPATGGGAGQSSVEVDLSVLDEFGAAPVIPGLLIPETSRQTGEKIILRPPGKRSAGKPAIPAPRARLAAPQPGLSRQADAAETPPQPAPERATIPRPKPLRAPPEPEAKSAPEPMPAPKKAPREPVARVDAPPPAAAMPGSAPPQPAPSEPAAAKAAAAPEQTQKPKAPPPPPIAAIPGAAPPQPAPSKPAAAKATPGAPEQTRMPKAPPPPPPLTAMPGSAPPQPVPSKPAAAKATPAVPEQTQMPGAPPPPPPVTAMPGPAPPGPAPPEPAVAEAMPGAPKQTAAVAPAPKSLGKGSTLRIAFEGGSAKLPDEAKADLDALARALAKDSGHRLRLKAYAAGTEEGANRARRLSLSRALAVRSYLIRQGLRSTRIDVRALGDRAEGGPADRVDLLVVIR